MSNRFKNGDRVAVYSNSQYPNRSVGTISVVSKNTVRVEYGDTRESSCMYTYVHYKQCRKLKPKSNFTFCKCKCGACGRDCQGEFNVEVK